MDFFKQNPKKFHYFTFWAFLNGAKLRESADPYVERTGRTRDFFVAMVNDQPSVNLALISP
jgi:hypothetical protein